MGNGLITVVVHKRGSQRGGREHKRYFKENWFCFFVFDYLILCFRVGILFSNGCRDVRTGGEEDITVRAQPFHVKTGTFVYQI